MSYIGKGVEVVTFNTATTLDVAGNITVGGTVDGRDVATDGTKLDTITSGAIADILQDTTPQLGGNLDLNTSNVIGTGNINVTGSITGTSFVSTGDMSFTNNSKAIFGTSPSLEIYHDGSNSILDDVGAGNFKMQLAGADKLEITSTGVDVTGTVTSDGLTVDTDTLHVDSTNNRVGIGTISPARQLEIYDDGTNGQAVLALTAQNTENSRIMFADPDDNNIGIIDYNHSDDSMRFNVNNAERLRIDSSGNVGIGTSSPSDTLEVSNASNYQLRLTSSGQNYQIGRNGSDGLLHFYGNQSGYTGYVFSGVNGERMRITSNGSVGIGTSSPATTLDVFKNAGSNQTVATIGAQNYGDGGATYVQIGTQYGDGSSRIGSINTGGNASALVFEPHTATSGVWSEAMRIDSSGQLIVGHTGSGSPYFNEGIVLNPAGDSVFHRDGNSVVDFSRQTSDGNIVRFVKDNSVVGSIGTVSDKIYIGSSAGGDTFLRLNSNTVTPANSSGADRDATINLGYSGGRFQNLFLSGGVYLGGTGSANHLDDYEEGTWTPTIGGSGATYGNQQGLYTKVGRYVCAVFDITVNARNSGTTNELHGFPFTANNGVSPAMGVYSGNVSFYSGISQNLYSMDMYIINGTTNAVFTGHTAASGTISNSLAVWQNGARILGTVHYFAE